MISTFENRWIVFSDGGKIELKDFFYNHYAGFSVFANRFIPDRSACEDIVQDVFLAFWERPRTFRNLLSLKAFFYTSIRNICLDEIKHLKVEQKYFELNREELAAGTYLDEIVKIEAYNEVYREINRLPEMERKVLLLALDGRPNEEIADYLHISVNTVRTHKARAYKVLRKKLGGVFLVFYVTEKKRFPQRITLSSTFVNFFIFLVILLFLFVVFIVSNKKSISIRTCVLGEKL